MERLEAWYMKGRKVKVDYNPEISSIENSGKRNLEKSEILTYLIIESA